MRDLFSRVLSKIKDGMSITFTLDNVAEGDDFLILYPDRPCEVTFKIRHTPEYHPATLEWTGDGEFIVHSKERIHGVAPGQFCVIYDEDHHRCLGSGEITV